MCRHSAQCPPLVKLADVRDQEHRERLELIRSKYRETFGNDPEFYVRAPGRVNLIGEHIDYCGYAVLPMAIQQDILLACGRNIMAVLQLANVDSRYPSYSTPMDDLKIDDVRPCWHHYFMCGVKAAVEESGCCELGVSSPGLDVMVHGTVPQSAGLSSSSALLHQRAVHVYEEASRVWQFKDVCEGGRGSLPPSEQLSMLGKLMNDSHTSCRDLYECSHPDLDRLVEVSLQAGALGSRLTGAGWGGCSISLVPSDKLDVFLKEVGTKFYGKLGDSLAKETAMFVTKPGSGAAIFLP
ncbi:hypothetical protein HPB50_020367 [Hyalomma asiaticum]|uniref:Uncharacterized protein n=1 Tax=Hyalomma asiaticum TaxID=266040 RepID=A0ACB7SP56_HYAAI|nr:hypothetical protein HPB50_020367 [Hyalomma asiaticum]